MIELDPAHIDNINFFQLCVPWILIKTGEKKIKMAIACSTLTFHDIKVNENMVNKATL